MRGRLKQRCFVEPSRKRVLALGHPVVFPEVHLQGHEFKIGDDLIQARSDGERDDVIDGQWVPCIGSEGNGGRLAAPPVVQACGVQAFYPAGKNLDEVF
jgi:hypothetical protein